MNLQIDDLNFIPVTEFELCDKNLFQLSKHPLFTFTLF